MLQKRTFQVGLLVTAASLLVASALIAQTGGSLEIPAVRFGAGTESVSSGGNFSLEGSAGDPSVSASSGGSFFVAGGFWGALYGYRTAVDDPTPTLRPRVFALYPSAPNPFNPRTTISFDLPTAEHVSVRIYNVRGVLVQTLVEERREAGHYQIEWDGRDRNSSQVASGVYMVHVQAGRHSGRHKISLVK